MVETIERQPRLLLRVDEAAISLGLARSTLYVLIRQHEIPVVRIGKAVRIVAADLAAWVEAQALRESDRKPPAGRDAV